MRDFLLRVSVIWALLLPFIPMGFVAAQTPTVTPTPISAEIPDVITWTQTSGMFGGDVYALVINPRDSNTLYAGSRGGGVFKSTDGGKSWKATNEGLTDLGIQSLAIASRDSGTLYAGTAGSGVFRSADGGESWTPSNAGLADDEVNVLAIDPDDARTLYAGTAGRPAYYDIQKGDTLAEIAERFATTVGEIAMFNGLMDPDAPLSPGQRLVIPKGGVFKSEDGGESWKKLSQGWSTRRIESIAIDPQNSRVLYVGTYGGGIFKSSDGGSSWRQKLDSGNIWSLAIDPQDSDILYAGESDGIFKSTDGGETWEQKFSGVFRSIAVAPSYAQVIYAGTNNGVLISQDRGTTWRDAGLSGTKVLHLALNQADSSLIYAGTEGRSVWKGYINRLVFVRPLLEAAHAHFSQGEYQEAINSYQEALAGYREIGDLAGQAEALKGISQVRVQLGEYELAIDHYQEALEKYQQMGDDAALAEVYSSLGSAYLSLEQHQQAIEMYSQAIKLAPQNVRIYSNRAWAYYNLGDYERAIADYNEAIALEPENARHYSNRARTYHSMGDYERAIADFGKAIELEPGNARYYSDRAETYYSMGNYEQAIADYDEAIKLEPGNARYYSDRAETYHSMGNYKQAIADYDEAIELEPGNARYYSDRAETYHSMRNYEQAIADYDEAIKLEPGNARYYSDLAETYHSMGNHEQAIVNFSQAIDLEPENAGYYYNRATVYLAEQEYRKARNDYEKAKMLDPTLVVPDLPAPSNWPRALAFSTILALVTLLGLVYFLVARPNQIPFATALQLLLAPRQLACAVGEGYVERSWHQWQHSVESNIMRQRRVTAQMLRDIPRPFRDYALRRYYQERQAEEDLSFEEDGLSLRSSARTRAWLKASRKAMAVLGGDDAQQREEFLQQSATLMKVLSGALGLVQLESRSYMRMHGYVVEAPALRLRVPPRFPVIFPQRITYDENDIVHLANFMGVLGMTDFFALLVVFDLPSDGQNVAGLRRLVKDSPYAHDFIVLGNDEVLSILKARDSNTRLIHFLLAQVDLSLVSPYVTSGPVPENMFFGRENEIKTITQTIRDNDFTLAGGRKIGKTSTLQKVHRLLDKDTRYGTFYLDCQPITTYEEFADALGRKLEHEMDAAPASFRDAAAWLKQKAGNKVVVALFDEVDNLLMYDVEREEHLFKVFRSLSQEGYCRFVFCGGKALYKRIHHPDSPFFNFCKEIILGHLDEKSAAEIITRPMADMGIELQSKDLLVDRIIRISSCHPNLVQFICERLINRRVRRITLEDLRAVTTSQEFYQYFIETTWGQSTPLEKIITLAMLDHRRFTRGEVYATLSGIGVEDKAAVDEALEILQLYTLLRQEGKNYLYALTEFPRIMRESEDVRALIESLLGRV